ncbi:Unknown protein [Striga hermonthica]|uniref:Tf2-1-like SH3-like domain-containing protein n=1 Tax=Striga hermonthica TaxID=68872 RepID=A0A9N7N3T2_STRHE|nr:Unknown protein [Striga hermonthica]
MPAAYRYARAQHELLVEARDSLAKAQRRMKKYANRGRRDVQFAVGDLVLLKVSPKVWKRISAKAVHRGLIPKYEGPFEIVSKVGNVAYRLKMPDRLKVHPTFHLSYLKKYHPDLIEASRNVSTRAPLTNMGSFKTARRLPVLAVGDVNRNFPAGLYKGVELHNRG